MKNNEQETIVLVCARCGVSRPNNICPRCGRITWSFLAGRINCLTPIDERDK